MKNGLATWHYPHRTVLENVAYFADNGFESVSLHGNHMDEICRSEENSLELARLLNEKNLVLTVHYKLPADHGVETVRAFYESIDRIASWQKKHGKLCVLSFDVLDKIRDNVAPYIEYVLKNVPVSKIAGIAHTL